MVVANAKMDVTLKKAEDDDCCTGVTANTYSFIAGIGFGCMAYATQHQVLLKITRYLTSFATTPILKKGYHYHEDIQKIFTEGSDLFGQPFMSYFLWAMAVFHLSIVFVSNPMVFYTISYVYGLAQYGIYAVALVYYYIFGNSMYITGGFDMAKIKEAIENYRYQEGIYDDGSYHAFKNLIDAQRGIASLIMGLILTAFGYFTTSISKMYLRHANSLVHENQIKQHGCDL